MNRTAGPSLYKDTYHLPPGGGTTLNCGPKRPFLGAGYGPSAFIAIDAFVAGYQVGTQLNDWFGISDYASDRGVAARDRMLDAGYSERESDQVGLWITFGALSPESNTLLSLLGL